jgi:predicted nucleic acid-binding protein
MRVFFDTNVWFSGIASNGLCQALLERSLTTHTVLSSALVWDELTAVLVRKLRYNEEELAEAERLFGAACRLTESTRETNDNDVRLVATAEQGDAQLFVTGDTRVLGWDAPNGMRIVKPREAWLMLYPITA